MDVRLEAVVLPVGDPDITKAFYESLGWRLDADVTTEDLRVVRMTPPGSSCSIVFGIGVTTAPPGSMRGLILSIADIEAARADLTARGISVSEIYHDAGGVFQHESTAYRVPGLDPRRRSGSSFASFDDPDGNGWTIQEAAMPAMPSGARVGAPA